MKLAKVIPLYKKNSPEFASNYRPISVENSDPQFMDHRPEFASNYRPISVENSDPQFMDHPVDPFHGRPQVVLIF